MQCCCQDLFKSLENKTEILDKLSAVEVRDVGFEIITLGEGQVLYGGGWCPRCCFPGAASVQEGANVLHSPAITPALSMKILDNRDVIITSARVRRRK